MTSARMFYLVVFHVVELAVHFLIVEIDLVSNLILDQQEVSFCLHFVLLDFLHFYLCLSSMLHLN